MAVLHPTEEERIAICEWLTANGINPKSVPLADHKLRIVTENGQRAIHYTEYVLTDDGRAQVDPEDPDSAWVREASRPCLVDPPKTLRIMEATI
jgi:hypothetical protein